jgi:hypothetical protein
LTFRASSLTKNTKSSCDVTATVEGVGAGLDRSISKDFSSNVVGIPVIYSFLY